MCVSLALTDWFLPCIQGAEWHHRHAERHRALRVCVSLALTDWFLSCVYRELNTVMLSDIRCLECVSSALTDWFLSCVYRELNGITVMLSNTGCLECVSSALTDCFLCHAYREFNIVMLSDIGRLECVYPQPSLTGFCALVQGAERRHRHAERHRALGVCVSGHRSIHLHSPPCRISRAELLQDGC